MVRMGLTITFQAEILLGALSPEKIQKTSATSSMTSSRWRRRNLPKSYNAFAAGLVFTRLSMARPWVGWQNLRLKKIYLHLQCVASSASYSECPQVVSSVGRHQVHEDFALNFPRPS